MFGKVIADRLRRPLVAALLVGASALPSWAESLGDTLVAAYRHSALLEQNRAVLRAADEDVATAMSSLRPILNWAISHSYSNVQVMGIEQDVTRTQAGLTAQMTLYDWGRSQIAIDGAKEAVMATRYALVGVEQNVLMAAVRAYLNVVSAQEQVQLQQNSVRVLSEEQQAAQDRFDVGEITLTDVSLADARVAESRAMLASAEGNLAVAREAFIAAVGRAPQSLDAAPPLPKLPKSLQDARATAQRTHPNVLQAQRQVAAAELGVAAAAAERNPNLIGQASTTLDKGNGGNPEFTASLQLSQPIYSGGRLSAQHRKAMANRDQARAGLLDVSRQVSEAVGTAWANIDVAAAQIAAIDRQISAAQRAYDGTREEAMLGARTTLDVLDAEQELLAARVNRVSAVANQRLAHYQLLSAMGLLTVEHLQLGIPTYDPTAYYNAVRNAPSTSRQGENLDRVLRSLGRQP